jgi:hypothetical protein
MRTLLQQEDCVSSSGRKNRSADRNRLLMRSNIDRAPRRLFSAPPARITLICDLRPSSMFEGAFWPTPLPAVCNSGHWLSVMVVTVWL